MRFDNFVEQHLLGAVTFIENATEGILGIHQHADRASLHCPSCMGGKGEGQVTGSNAMRSPPDSRIVCLIRIRIKSEPVMLLSYCGSALAGVSKPPGILHV